MRANKLLPGLKSIGKARLGVVGCAVLGAAFGGMAAGLYGVLCGTLAGVIHGDLGRIPSVGLYSVLCGAGAGTLVGGFARIIDPTGVADLANRWPQRPEQRDAVVLRPQRPSEPFPLRRLTV
jgi:hypothetical protein